MAASVEEFIEILSSEQYVDIGRLRHLSRHGVHPAVRGEVWMYLLGVLSSDKSHEMTSVRALYNTYDDLLSRCRVDEEVQRSIRDCANRLWRSRVPAPVVNMGETSRNKPMSQAANRETSSTSARISLGRSPHVHWPTNAKGSASRPRPPLVPIKPMNLDSISCPGKSSKARTSGAVRGPTGRQDQLYSTKKASTSSGSGDNNEEDDETSGIRPVDAQETHHEEQREIFVKRISNVVGVWIAKQASDRLQADQLRRKLRVERYKEKMRSSKSLHAEQLSASKSRRESLDDGVTDGSDSAHRMTPRAARDVLHPPPTSMALDHEAFPSSSSSSSSSVASSSAASLLPTFANQSDSLQLMASPRITSSHSSSRSSSASTPAYGTPHSLPHITSLTGDGLHNQLSTARSSHGPSPAPSPRDATFTDVFGTTVTPVENENWTAGLKIVGVDGDVDGFAEDDDDADGEMLFDPAMGMGLDEVPVVFPDEHHHHHHSRHGSTSKKGASSPRNSSRGPSKYGTPRLDENLNLPASGSRSPSPRQSQSERWSDAGNRDIGSGSSTSAGIKSLNGTSELLGLGVEAIELSPPPHSPKASTSSGGGANGGPTISGKAILRPVETSKHQVRSGYESPLRQSSTPAPLNAAKRPGGLSRNATYSSTVHGVGKAEIEDGTSNLRSQARSSGHGDHASDSRPLSYGLSSDGEGKQETHAEAWEQSADTDGRRQRDDDLDDDFDDNDDDDQASIASSASSLSSRQSALPDDVIAMQRSIFSPHLVHLAAPFAMVSLNKRVEAGVFFGFARLVELMRPPPALAHQLAVFHSLFRRTLPDLRAYFEEEGLDVTPFVSTWLRSLFAGGGMRLDKVGHEGRGGVLRLWDAYFSRVSTEEEEEHQRATKEQQRQQQQRRRRQELHRGLKKATASTGATAAASNADDRTHPASNANASDEDDASDDGGRSSRDFGTSSRATSALNGVNDSQSTPRQHSRVRPSDMSSDGTTGIPRGKEGVAISDDNTATTRDRPQQRRSTARSHSQRKQQQQQQQRPSYFSSDESRHEPQSLHLYVCLAVLLHCKDTLEELDRSECESFLRGLPELDVDKILSEALNLRLGHRRAAAMSSGLGQDGEEDEEEAEEDGDEDEWADDQDSDHDEDEEKNDEVEKDTQEREQSSSTIKIPSALRIDQEEPSGDSKGFLAASRSAGESLNGITERPEPGLPSSKAPAPTDKASGSAIPTHRRPNIKDDINHGHIRQGPRSQSSSRRSRLDPQLYASGEGDVDPSSYPTSLAVAFSSTGTLPPSMRGTSRHGSRALDGVEGTQKKRRTRSARSHGGRHDPMDEVDFLMSERYRDERDDDEDDNDHTRESSM